MNFRPRRQVSVSSVRCSLATVVSRCWQASARSATAAASPDSANRSDATCRAATSSRSRGGVRVHRVTVARSITRTTRTSGGGRTRRRWSIATVTGPGERLRMPWARSASSPARAAGQAKSTAPSRSCSDVGRPVWSTYTPVCSRRHTLRRTSRSIRLSSPPSSRTCGREITPCCCAMRCSIVMPGKVAHAPCGGPARARRLCTESRIREAVDASRSRSGKFSGTWRRRCSPTLGGPWFRDARLRSLLNQRTSLGWWFRQAQPPTGSTTGAQ